MRKFAVQCFVGVHIVGARHGELIEVVAIGDVEGEFGVQVWVGRLSLGLVHHVVVGVLHVHVQCIPVGVHSVGGHHFECIVTQCLAV